MYHKKEFEEMTARLNPEGRKTMVTDIISLITKLNEKGIENISLDVALADILGALTAYNSGDKSQKKKVGEIYSYVVSYARKEHNLVQKGYYTGVYMVVFAGAGVALGVTLLQVNTALLGIGIAVTAGVGVAVGRVLDKKAEREGRLY